MNYNLRIEQDYLSDNNPRDDDNLGTMVCWHRRYNLGDDQPKDSPQDYLRQIGKDIIMLPLYLYDHSGLTISTRIENFCQHAAWDSGQVGFIYVTKQKACQEFGWKRVSKVREGFLMYQLELEVKTYDAFLRGDVWGYVIEDDDGEHIDSCWGYYSKESAESDGREALKYHQRKEVQNV